MPEARRILVVEDNPVNQLVATAMLEELGFFVDAVADGAAAVRAASVTEYNAILMDCQLPVLTGYQATTEIRRAQGQSARIPIIAVTGSAVVSGRQRCLGADMDDYLTKPLSTHTLRAVLDRWAPDDSAHASSGPKPASVPPAASRVVAHIGRPVLDVQIVHRLRELGRAAGEDLLGQLATVFLADADERIVALRRDLATDDGAGVSRSAHALGGAASNLGATDLARLCSVFDADGASGNLAGGDALLGAIVVELDHVRAALASPELGS